MVQKTTKAVCVVPQWSYAFILKTRVFHQLWVFDILNCQQLNKMVRAITNSKEGDGGTPCIFSQAWPRSPCFSWSPECRQCACERTQQALCQRERETASYVCDSERPLPPRLGCMSVLTAGNRRVLNVICTKSNGIPLNTSMLRADLSPHKEIKINEIQIIKTKKELNWSTDGRKRRKMCC